VDSTGGCSSGILLSFIWLKKDDIYHEIFNLPGHFLQRLPFLNFLQQFFFPQNISVLEPCAGARGAILKGTMELIMQQI